jgi:hypothetical protein
MNIQNEKPQTIRKGLFSPFEMGGLALISYVVNEAHEIAKQDNIKFDNIFYTTAFQSGIDKFLMFPFNVEALEITDFVKKRISLLSNDYLKNNYGIIQKWFSEFIPKDDKNKESSVSITRLIWFVQDILTSMDLGSSMLTIVEPPSLNELSSKLPYQLLVPIQNLFSCIKYETVDVPVPRQTIMTDDIRRFQEILNSNLFLRYSSAQEEMEHNKSVTLKVVNNISKVGKQIFENNQTLFTIRRTVLSVLPATPILIETAFGKLPGAISKIACDCIQNLIKQKRNLVIYNFDKPLTTILWKRVFELIDTPDKKLEFYKRTMINLDKKIRK